MSRLLIAGGEVLAGPGRTLQRADVLLDAGRIERVAADVEPPEGTRRLDATAMIVIPGLVNAHTHGHNNLSRGLAGRWTLEQLISSRPRPGSRRTAAPRTTISDGARSDRDAEDGATAAYDLYMAVPLPDEEVLEPVVAAYSDLGLRVVLAPSMADGPFHRMMPGLLDAVPDRVARRLERVAAVPTARVLEVAAAAIRRFHGAGAGRVWIAVSPSIPGLCSDELLQGLAGLAREHGVGAHTHVAESRVQVAPGRTGCGDARSSRGWPRSTRSPPASPPRTASGSPPGRSRCLPAPGERGAQPGEQPPARQRHRTGS